MPEQIATTTMQFPRPYDDNTLQQGNALLGSQFVLAWVLEM